MVLSAVEPDRNTYRLFSPFYYPYQTGSRYAIAVPSQFGDHLISLYALLMQLFITQTWTVVVLAGVYLSMYRFKTPSHNTAVISVAMLNHSSMPTMVLTTLKFLWGLGQHATTRRLLFVWLAVSGVALAGSWAFPVFLTPYLVLGHAAPVAPTEIYVPSPSTDGLSYTDKTKLAIKLVNVAAPATLRAAGSAQIANGTTNSLVTVTYPETLQDRGNGEAVIRITYKYNVSGADFGLQRLPQLRLFIEGSCMSDYSWLINSTTTADGIAQDLYSVWGNPNYTQILSLNNAAQPVVYLFPPPNDPVDDGKHINTTYAVLISSVGRQSVSQGKDPFYLTEQNPDNDVYTVLSGRPGLNCWEDATWVYNEQPYSLPSLHNVPGISPALVDNVLQTLLDVPKIYNTMLYLGPSALLSATTSVGQYFDAGSASIHADLSRLILTSYIGTSNTMTDTTLFYSNSSGLQPNSIPNRVAPDNLTEVAGFVLYSRNVTALSIPMLAAIPIAVAVWICIVYFVTNSPWFAWYLAQALQASVLFRCLDEEMKAHHSTTNPPAHGVSEAHAWTHDLNSYFTGDSNRPVCIKAEFQEGTKALVWKKTAGNGKESIPPNTSNQNNGDSPTTPPQQSGKTEEMAV